MPDVLNRTTKEFRISSPPDETPPAQWIQSPVVGVTPMRDWIGSGARREPRYVNIVGDVVTEMTDIEKDAVDQAAADAATNQRRQDARGRAGELSDMGVEFRALVELFNKRDNYLVNRITELQEDLQAIKASTGAAQNIRDAIRASYLATNTRTKAQAIADYDADVAAGNQDT